MIKPTILIVDNHQKTSMVYASTFEVYLGAAVVEKSNLDDAIKYLESFSPDIILVRSKIGDRKADKVMLDLIKKSNLKSELFVVGTSDLSVHEAHIFSKDVEMKQLLTSIARLFNITAKDMAQINVGHYFPFKLSNLVPGLSLATGIYLKDKENNFSLFLDKENKLLKEIFNILKIQNVTEIYVKSEDRLKFINSQIMFLKEYLAEDELSLSERVFISNQAYKTVRENALRMQITPEVISMTETCIDTMQSILTKVPKLSELIKMLEKSAEENFQQSLLTSFICNHIIEHTEWGTYEHKVKLTFVSFFHNITLAPELILINSQEKMDQLLIPDKQKNEIMRHAIQAAKIVSEFKSRIPMGVDTIIKQHHGSRSGIGFSASPQSISPLALIFVVADEWVTAIMWAQKNDIKITKNQILNIVKNKYKTLSYEKIIRAMEKLEH